MSLFKRSDKNAQPYTPCVSGELAQANERLMIDNKNQKDIIDELKNRLRGAIYRAEIAEGELQRVKVELSIERTISQSDRMGEAREALNKMAALVRSSQEERDKALKRLSELENKTDSSNRKPLVRKPRPGRVPFEWRDTRTITKTVREQVYTRDGGKCRYCGAEVDIRSAHIDHVYPHSQGGKTIPENLVVSCLACNMDKVDRIGYWPRPLSQEMQQ